MRAAALFILIFIAGCAQTIPRSGPLPPPALPPQAQWTLEQVPPPTAALPNARAQTQPDTQPPVEALSLYAASRDEMIDSHPAEAITLLKKAIDLDPDSFTLYRALGEAYLAVSHHESPEEIAAFENAVALNPDDLHLQAILGTQYAAMGDTGKALWHLRLAVLTSDYSTDDVAATEVDYVLAPILQRLGYDRAALDRYVALLKRLDEDGPDPEQEPELAEVVSNPQPIWVQVALLQERRGNWADALAAYQAAVQGDPSSFALQSRVIQMLANLGRFDEAFFQAADVVMRFGDTSDAVNLLESVARDSGRNPADVLRNLRQSHPDNPALLLALSDVLVEQGDRGQAIGLLESALPSFPNNRTVVDRLFNLYLDQDNVPAAAKLLVIYLAANPDSIGEIEPMWAELLRTSRPNSLQISDLQKMPVDASAEAARQYLIWRLSDMWRRDVSARQALEASVAANPNGQPFSPAYRQLIQNIWSRPDWDRARKEKECEALAQRADSIGQPGLGAELRGLSALNDSNANLAVSNFEQAIALNDSSPSLLLVYADTLQVTGQSDAAEALYKRLVADHPLYGQAWQSFFGFYLRQQKADQARGVIGAWLAADPSSLPARILEADLRADGGDAEGAETELLRLFADHGDDPDLISALITLGRRTGHLENFLSRLNDLRRREPANETAVEWLVGVYADEGRDAEAEKVLDENRAAVGHDPDLLYQIAHLYDQIHRSQVTESVLEQVVSLDPNHASACNDLGYTWADEGKNLPRAEALIRVAVGQEPDNQSFLDSLGWVLYKQHRYAEAETNFQKAVDPSLAPDPVVLDHYGDVLYRLGRVGDAVRQWQRSLSGLDQVDNDRPDLRDLRSVLTRKLDEQLNGRPVSVAPVAN